MTELSPTAVGTIDGRFRVTEQGEMINANFGNEGIAERSLGARNPPPHLMDCPRKTWP